MEEPGTADGALRRGFAWFYWLFGRRDTDRWMSFYVAFCRFRIVEVREMPESRKGQWHLGRKASVVVASGYSAEPAFMNEASEALDQQCHLTAEQPTAEARGRS